MKFVEEIAVSRRQTKDFPACLVYQIGTYDFSEVDNQQHLISACPYT